jgi:Tfp pilus assembly protein PilN
MKTQSSHTLQVRITPQEIMVIANGKSTGNEPQPPLHTIQLASTDIVNHHVVNLTALAHHVDTLITACNLRYPNVAIHAPFLEEGDSYALFSLALCLSKCTCTVTRISTVADGPNLLDALLPPRYHQTYRWLALGGVCCCAVALAISSRNAQLSRTRATTTSTIANLTTSLDGLKRTVASSHAIEQENATLKKKITALSTLTTKSIGHEELLTAIADTIPATAHLVHVTIGKHSPSISLAGTTTTPHEINAWVKKLSAQQKQFTFSLANLTKQKRIKAEAKAPVVYAFMIHASYAQGWLPPTAQATEDRTKARG